MRAVRQNLPAVHVGLGASVFTIAPPPGQTDYYADAKSQIATLISLASSFKGDPSAIQPIVNTMATLVNDVANFNAVDKAAITSSQLWKQMLTEAPTQTQVTRGVYSLTAAQSLALDATTIGAMMALMPSTTAAQVAAATTAAATETYAGVKYSTKGTVATSTIVPGVTVTQTLAPVMPVATSPTPPSALASLPWNFIIGGALVVAAILFVTEEKKR